MAADGRPNGWEAPHLIDTIFALSSGTPPAAIAIVRVSGPAALDALAGLGVDRPPVPRRPRLTQIRANGELLDTALILFFDSPATSTGEDVVELHLHGGRAVVDGVLAALGAMTSLRPAEAGEFTRRAFENGRIDLAEAEGLADLLAAETQSQRRAALMLASGALSRRIDDWARRILMASAQVEALLDFGDEDDVGSAAEVDWRRDVVALARDVQTALDAPSAERLRDGVRIVIAGPPNAGKSSLFNAISGRDAAITSSQPGTTRDVIEASLAIEGVAVLLCDTAGVRISDDEIERIGVERAQAAVAGADIVLWLGPPEEAPPVQCIRVASFSDIRGRTPDADFSVSTVSGGGLHDLIGEMLRRSRALLPGASDLAINNRHREILMDAGERLSDALATEDLLIAAESLRSARASVDRITGRAGVEDMLDSLFRRFCIGK